jgi:hypothetical protein
MLAEVRADARVTGGRRCTDRGAIRKDEADAIRSARECKTGGWEIRRLVFLWLRNPRKNS